MILYLMMRMRMHEYIYRNHEDVLIVFSNPAAKNLQPLSKTKRRTVYTSSLRGTARSIAVLATSHNFFLTKVSCNAICSLKLSGLTPASTAQSQMVAGRPATATSLPIW